jgi:hypothetical protein
MKADLRISVKDYSRNKNLKIQHWLPLRRVAGFQKALGLGFDFGV